MVSYRNLLVNFDQLMSGYWSHSGGVAPLDSTFVSWLPFYHDMGLALGVCAPILLGLPAVLTSPVSFLQRPARWMQLLATNSHAFSAAPNFAFELAARKTSDDDMAGRDLGGVQTILSGSERVHPATLKRFAERFARFNLHDRALRPSYGLAEATVYVASSRADQPPEFVDFDPDKLSAGHAKRCASGDGTPLVSYPLRQSPTVRIVDPETQTECPEGTTGEIWVHGDNVAMGYWRKPQQTERTFGAMLVAPSVGTPEGPWLRTGDLGFICDGELFIVGRIKDLLIVYGRNHSPDDIEATIQEITRGRCAAIAVPDGGTEQLVVIIEVKQRGDSAEDVMHKFAVVKRDVTSAISNSHGLGVADLVLVPPGSIPITTSGKVRRAACVEQYRHGQFARLDTGALPAAEYQDGDCYRAPASAVEEILAGIYAQVLGLERVGVDESFFDLGGDSLSAMRLVAAINTSLDAGLAVRTLFDAPSVAQLAPRIGGDAGRLEPLVAGERPAVVPLSFAQSRLWFLDQLLGPSPIYNTAVAVRLRGRLDADALGAALADVVGRHESLRTLFAAPEGIPRQLVVAPERADFGWQVVDATGWPASRLGEAIDTAARHPFDLATEIPLRARLFRVTDDEHVLVATVHHIAADGWSITPLVGDLGVAYASRCAGRAPGWAPLAVQYVDYTLWQREQLGDLADTRQPHRRAAGVLGGGAWPGCPSACSCPPIGPIRRLLITAAPVWSVDWPAELQQRVRGVAREHNATSFMVIQAALAVLLSKLSASSEVAVGFPIAGRRDPALDELVGFFVNTLVLRVDVAGDPTVAELLAQVRRRSLAAYEHQDVPFEVLVERLNPTRSLTHHPLVQVMLAWQNLPGHNNDPAAGLALGDLQVTPLPVDTHTARMDLTFSLAERWTEAGEPAGIGGTVEFRTDVFDAASIETLIERLRAGAGGDDRRPDTAAVVDGSAR